MRAKKQRGRVTRGPLGPPEYPSSNILVSGISIPEGYEEIPVIRPSRNRFFNAVIQDLIDKHEAKNHDYAAERNPFSNFDIAVQWLKRHGIELTSYEQIESMKATKFARLVNLVLERETEPNFESVDDTELDFVVYWILRKADNLRNSCQS